MGAYIYIHLTAIYSWLNRHYLIHCKNFIHADKVRETRELLFQLMLFKSPSIKHTFIEKPPKTNDNDKWISAPTKKKGKLINWSRWWHSTEQIHKLVWVFFLLLKRVLIKILFSHLIQDNRMDERTQCTTDTREMNFLILFLLSGTPH